MVKSANMGAQVTLFTGQLSVKSNLFAERIGKAEPLMHCQLCGLDWLGA